MSGTIQGNPMFSRLRGGRQIGAAVVGLGLLLASTTQAFAHARYDRSEPPAGAMVDGQPLVLLPGYKNIDGQVVGAGPGESVVVNPLPYFAAELCKRQNPQMGTEDPEDPKDFECLLGVEEWGDDVSPIEQSDKEERMDRSMLDDEARTATPIRRRSKRGRKSGRKYSDPRLKNPGGIRADIAD